MQSLDIGTVQQFSQFHLPDHNTHFSVQLNNGMQSQDHICYIKKCTSNQGSLSIVCLSIHNPYLLLLLQIHEYRMMT